MEGTASESGKDQTMRQRLMGGEAEILRRWTGGHFAGEAIRENIERGRGDSGWKTTRVVVRAL